MVYSMNKKTRLSILILILIILILICKMILKIDRISYKVKYNDKDFYVDETFKNNNYYIEIKHSNTVYPIRIYNNNKKRKIIDKIYYYKDKTHECLLPIINGKISVDMMCYKDNILYDYNKVIGDNSKLDDYIKTIEEYDINKFKDNTSNEKTIGTVKLYRNNDIDKSVVITTYKGLIINGMEIELFKNDIYNNEISTFIDNYYLTADYDNTYDFDYFYLVNLTSSNIEKIKIKDSISLDSYIQGIVDNKVYLYDKDNENQYEIDVAKKEIKLIASGDKVKYYKNNKWETINKLKAKKELYFDFTTLNNDFTDYDQVIESKDYYYLLNKNNKNYDLYRVDKNNLEIYKFIGTIPTNLIYTKDNYLYYEFNNKLYFYSDNLGVRTLLEDTEFSFNNTIKYYIY